MIIWLSVLTGYVGLLKRKLFKSEANIKYLLPFIQDKTLKALTSYIDNDSDELLFDENGELVEKLKKIESESETTKISNNLFNKKFEPLPEDCKCRHINEAIQKRIVHKIAKYRFYLDRDPITTSPSKVCLYWKPGTIFAQTGNDWVQFFILTETNPFNLYSSVDDKRAGNYAVSSFENFTNAKIELLALPEEYLK